MRTAARCSTIAALGVLTSLLGLAFAGCRDDKSPAAANRDSASSATGAAAKPKLIAVTIVPLHMLTAAVAGDGTGVRIELLLSPEIGCPHDYALTPRDKKRVDDADAILCIGAGLESFLEPLRKKHAAKFVDLGGECDLIKGDAHEHDHEGDHHDHADHDHAHDTAANPHVWLSPAQSIRLTRAIERELSKLDPANKSAYVANAGAFIKQLEALDAELRDAATTLKGRKVAASDAFAYLARDLGIDVAVNLPDHESESVPARAKAELTKQIKDRGVQLIITEKGAKSPLAEAVARDTGVPMLALDALTHAEKIPTPPDAYQSRTRANIAALLKALAK